MKNLSYTWMIIMTLIIIIILQRSCSNCNCPQYEPSEAEIIIEPGDLVFTEEILEIPEPVIISMTDSLIMRYPEIDTAAILRDYFRQRIYHDTLKDDSSAFIRHDFTIFRNRLTASSLIFKNRRQKTILKQELRPVESARAKFYAGLAVGRKYNEFGAGLSLALNTRKDHLYSLSYDVINKDVYFSMYWKISIK